MGCLQVEFHCNFTALINFKCMEHKKKLEELNNQSLHKLEEYIKTKEVALKEVDHKTLHQAKEEWQLAWNKLMEALLVLERIEI